MSHDPRAHGVLLLSLLALTASAHAQETDRNAVTILRKFVQSETHSRTASELDELRKLGQSAVDPLCKVLLDRSGHSEQMRCWAAYALRRIGNKSALPTLVEALHDPSWRVRKNAANSLGALGDKETIRHLLKRTEDPIRTARQSVFGAINKLSRPAALPLLIAAFRKAKFDRARSQLLHTIGQLDDSNSTALFLEALDDPYHRVRGNAIYYLATLAPDALRPHVSTLLTDKSSSVRQMAARVLPMLGQPLPLKQAVQLLSDPDYRVRHEMASSLSYLTGPVIQKALLAALAIKQEAEVLITLYSSLGRSRPLTALAGLIRCLENESLPESLRAQALYALSRLRLRRTISILIESLDSRQLLLRQIALYQLESLTGQSFKGRTARSAYQAWWHRSRKNFTFKTKAQPAKTQAGSGMHTWRTSHYVLRTNVDALLAERILLTMEMMHSAYNRLYTPPASLGQQTPELLLALGGRHHQTSEGEVYRMPAGQQVVRYRESKLRLVIHTDGKRVLLKPDRTRRIHFPWGRVVNGWPRSQALHKTSIRLFWRRKGYRQYAKTTDPKWPFLQDAGGYFSPTRQEIVTYSKPSRSNLLQTLAHEAQHQVLSTHIKRAPVWLNEGLSEYYEQSSYTRGQLSHDVHLAHLNYVARLIREKSNTPLSKLVQLNYNQFHNDSFGPAEIGHYALSWSLVYFLLTAEEGRYRGLFARLFRALKDGALAREAVPHYLKAAGLDWDHLQMRWADYISRLAHENSVKKKPRPQGEK